MAATIDLKNKVLEYVEEADERLLKMIYALAETYREDEGLSVSHKRELDIRLEKYNRGETRFYSWNEISDKIK